MRKIEIGDPLSSGVITELKEPGGIKAEYIVVALIVGLLVFFLIKTYQDEKRTNGQSR